METKDCSAAIGNEQKSPRKKNCRSKIKQRFSDEQIKFMESIFESEARLEPRKKVQLARELGLQPRQVAIWFQNKRARWRIKQIEQDYQVVKGKYEDLKSQFESLKEERQTLLSQLKALNDKLEEGREMEKDNKRTESPSIDGNSPTLANSRDMKAEPSFSFEHDQMFPQDHKNRNYGYSTEDILEYPSIDDSVDCALAFNGRWSSFYSDNLFDQSYNNSNWNDFWT